MEKIVFIDTETNGLPKNKYQSAIEKTNNWPELVSIAWMTFINGTMTNKELYIIKPNGYKITKSIDFHHITHEKAKKEGYPMKFVLDRFTSEIAGAYKVVAYNMEFDKNVILNAYKWHLEQDTSFWKESAELCMMKEANPSGSYIKLDTLYTNLFGCVPPPNSHTADRDVDVLQQIYWKLHKL